MIQSTIAIATVQRSGHSRHSREHESHRAVLRYNFNNHEIESTHACQLPVVLQQKIDFINTSINGANAINSKMTLRNINGQLTDLLANAVPDAEITNASAEVLSRCEGFTRYIAELGLLFSSDDKAGIQTKL